MFVIGSFVPSLLVDRIGRRQPMMWGSLGLWISMMLISVLLSFKGSSVEKETSTASVAFFFTVSPSYHTYMRYARLTNLTVHAYLRCIRELHPLGLCTRNSSSSGQSKGHRHRNLFELALGTSKIRTFVAHPEINQWVASNMPLHRTSSSS